MRGQMMDHPLTLTPFLERARTLFPRREIVTKAGSTLLRSTYADLARRAARMARALAPLGGRRGDRGATLAWPRLDEQDAAAMCYTSGTTGNPKGVVYSHRALYLHTCGLAMGDSFGLSERDTFMPVVPMFHAMAWGTPFACAMLGMKTVLPGPHLQPRDLAELVQAERVTLTAGVPTLWLGLLGLLEREQYDLSSLRTLIVGGAAAPRSMSAAFE